MKLGDTIFNGNQFKNVILNSTSYKRLILGVNLVWSYFGIAIKSFKTRILADSGTYEAESILEDKLQEITPDLFDSASLVITPNGVKTSKLYSIKPNDGTGDLSVTRATTATRVNESGNIVDVPANVARIDYSTGQPAILVEPQRTNLVYPSDIATTQVRAVTSQVYTLSFYGSGTVTLSGAFSGSLVGTGANNRVSLTFIPTAGNLTLTVSGSVTNWQLEAGNNATSLIPTTTGAVTRNADNVFSTNNISSLIGLTEGTLYTEFIASNSTNSNSGILSLRDSSGDNRLLIRFNVSSLTVGGYLNFLIRSNNIEAVNLNAGNLIPVANQKYKVCVTYNQTKQKIFVNGALLSTKTGSYPVPSNINIAQIGATLNNLFISPINIYNSIIFKKTLTDAQAIQLTTL